jgi:alkylhydroperoxidase family enzyme
MFLTEPPDSPAGRAAQEDDRQSEGFVMNATRLWCWRPDALESLYATRGVLTDSSSLSAADIAVLNAATASARENSYCSLAWGDRLAAQTSPEVAGDVLSNSLSRVDARTAALSTWARKVTLNPNSTTAADVDLLHDVGLDDRQIFEATFLIAWRVAFTTVNDALGAQPDGELAAGVPEAVRAAVTYGRKPA